MKENKSSSTWKNYMLPMIIIALMFSILGFAVGINAFFVPFLKKAFNITSAMSYMVTTATFGAFVLFGMPSGKVLEAIGYKKSMVVAFVLMCIGMLIIVPAARYQSFILFLVALFVNGIGLTLLNTAINPYITILGPEDSAAKRISIMGACNKLSFGLAPIILAKCMNTTNIALDDTVVPFYFIAAIFAALGIFSFISPLPEVKAVGEESGELNEEFVSVTKTSIFQFPHLLLGSLAIFLYVGVETIALVSINDYAIEIGLASPERFALFTSAGYIIGYGLGIILIPKWVSQINTLKIWSTLGIISALLIVFLPGHLSIYCLAFMGFANSLIWPAIWPLALANLGRFTKAGSSLLVTGIAGGGLIPPLLGLIKDHSTYHQAYWMLLPVYIYFLFYALVGRHIQQVFGRKEARGGIAS
jgi:MFS transporter, FHS family, L-fucose permease